MTTTNPDGTALYHVPSQYSTNPIDRRISGVPVVRVGLAVITPDIDGARGDDGARWGVRHATIAAATQYIRTALRVAVQA